MLFLTAGSRFWQVGTFEVIKTTSSTVTEPEGSAVRGGLDVITYSRQGEGFYLSVYYTIYLSSLSSSNKSGSQNIAKKLLEMYQ
jgi:hypothetical protein